MPLRSPQAAGSRMLTCALSSRTCQTVQPPIHSPRSGHIQPVLLAVRSAMKAFRVRRQLSSSHFSRNPLYTGAVRTLGNHNPLGILEVAQTPLRIHSWPSRLSPATNSGQGYPARVSHTGTEPRLSSAAVLVTDDNDPLSLRDLDRSVSAARQLHTSSHMWLPSGGGYMRTGHVGNKPREPKYLVTGACGQIGMELVPYLRARVGVDAVLASDIKTSSREYLESGPFVYADVQDYESLARIVLEHGINHIIHLASLLSAIGEKNPQLALKINTRGIQNVLELARQHDLRVYAPSTIAVFGPTTPKDNTPNTVVMEPTTMYGITKVHLELLGRYYNRVYGVDFRSLRYPGVISALTKPGGGTTDYAVEIYHEALRRQAYDCFLEEHQILPMMYVPDCLKATLDLIHAPRPKLTECVYNVTAMSFTPSQLAASITAHIPDFRMHYHPDFRQDIAQTWPRTIDDSPARRDWGWQPDYDIESMTADMLVRLGEQRDQIPHPVPSPSSSPVLSSY